VRTSSTAQPGPLVSRESTETIVTGLTPLQADGLACVLCGTACRDNPVPHRPIGRSTYSSQIFACAHCVPDTVVVMAEGRPR
jgi:hypothetical protein